MQKELWNSACQEKLEQGNRKPEVCPVMSIFHDLERVTLEVDFAIKIHLRKCCHGNLVLAMVLRSVSLGMKGEVVVNWTTRESGLFILAR